MKGAGWILVISTRRGSGAESNLTLELDLAFNFARLSQQYRDAANRERAFRSALVALGVVRRLEGQISDPKAWKLIHERADGLERLLEQIDKAV